MKRLLAIALAASVLCGGASAADKYVFSADGETAGSAPRELPSQGFDRYTGQVVVGLHMRTDAEKAACGWYMLVETPPPGVVVSNEYWAVGGYFFDGTFAYQRWERRWRKVATRRFSKLRCVTALMSAGVWPQVKAWIESAGLYDLYLAAQEFADSDPYFKQGRAQLQAELGWTDAQVEAVLKEAEIR